VQTVVNIARPALIEQSYGGGQPNINAEVVKAFRVPLPPIDEQLDILAAIKNVTANVAVDSAIREITLLLEFRTRLVADVVTGKLDVRATAMNLPENLEREPIDELSEDEEHGAPVDDADIAEAAA
jgi:type I restriction enzyme, S subunit